MRRVVLMVIASVLVFSFGAAAQDLSVSLAPSTPAGAAAIPPAFSPGSEFPIRVSFGYQFNEFRNQDGLTFHNNGINTDLTGYLGHDFSLEGDVSAGFGWARKTPTLNLESSSVFYGGGVRIGGDRRRFEPWVHALVGGEHLRFSEYSSSLGSNNGLAYQLGIGADFKLGARAFWIIQGDYLGTREFSANQANYQFGTGVAFAF